MDRIPDPERCIKLVKLYVLNENCAALQRVVNELKCDAKARPLLIPAYRAVREALVRLMADQEAI